MSQQPARMLLTVVLRHDQSMTLAQIQEHLKATGFYAAFPPPDVEVVSWNVAMGLGQVLVLSLPPGRLRAVNRLIEEKVWGAFRTEFYASYDFAPVWNEIRTGGAGSPSP